MFRRTPLMIALSLLAGASSADVITIRNNLNSDLVLSDLIVWDDAGKQEVILKPGFDPAESADDETMKKGESRVFVTTITVKKYFLSSKNDNSEAEYKPKAGDVGIVAAQAAALTDPSGLLSLHLEAVSDEGANLVLPEGLILMFENGQSPEAPGWFVGTQADFFKGEILAPYSGPAIVRSSGVEVTVDPTPECVADLDGNRQLDADDFFLFLDYFARGCE